MRKNNTMKIGTLILVLFLITSSVSIPIHSDTNPNDPLLIKCMDLLRQLQDLHNKDINVTTLVQQLNEAVQLASEGKREQAKYIIDNVERNITKLQAIADHHYHVVLAYKAIEVGLILSFPVLFYFGFPRLYLYIWFRLRRRWIVKDGSA